VGPVSTKAPLVNTLLQSGVQSTYVPPPVQDTTNTTIEEQMEMMFSIWSNSKLCKEYTTPSVTKKLMLEDVSKQRVKKNQSYLQSAASLKSAPHRAIISEDQAVPAVFLALTPGAVYR
jgi:hypothetical protein